VRVQLVQLHVDFVAKPTDNYLFNSENNLPISHAKKNKNSIFSPFVLIPYLPSDGTSCSFWYIFGI